MVTVGMNYQVLPGKGKQFEDVCRAVVDTMRGMDGHRDSHLYRDVFEPERYLIVSEWADRAAFDAFVSSERFRSVTTWGKEQILAGRPQHEYYEK